MDSEVRFVLALFVSGRTPAAQRAQRNLERLCGEMLGGRYEIEIVDVRDDPDRAEQYGVLATPMVVRTHPPPVRRIIGDLSDEEQALFGLDLEGFRRGG